MTRKCIICKSKNYKNAYSFFSAPKDPDARRLWQQAINIKDYVVNDETFVCSKHFKKDDIVTHWVSGVPPQVITIKYKKCRLRRGAVPIPVNITSDFKNVSEENENNGSVLDGRKYLFESKQKEINNIKDLQNIEVFHESLSCNLEDEIYEYIPEDSQEPIESENDVLSEPQKKRKIIENNECINKLINYHNNENDEVLYIDYSNLNNSLEEENDNSIHIHVKNGPNVLTYFPRKSYSKTNKKPFNKHLSSSITEDKNQINSCNYWQVDSQHEKDDIDETNKFSENVERNKFDSENSLVEEITNSDNHSMLFEDFLEIYNEALLPSNWIASMVCKGSVTTIVYSRMNVSKTGMPYIERKVFLNNKMIVRCGIFNKEINLSSFMKNKQSFMVQSLSDVEDVIEQLNRLPLCAGISNKDLKDENNFLVTLDDGDIQRHSDCSLIVDKEHSICSHCSSLIISNEKCKNNR